MKLAVWRSSIGRFSFSAITTSATQHWAGKGGPKAGAGPGRLLVVEFQAEGGAGEAKKATAERGGRTRISRALMVGPVLQARSR